VITTGVPKILLELSKSIWTPSGKTLLTSELRSKIVKRIKEIALKIEKSYIVTITLLIAIVITLARDIIGFYAYIREPYIARQIILYSYTKVSRYRIDFYMKPNNIYGDIVASAENKLPIY
jgi:hypothetical protein